MVAEYGRIAGRDPRDTLFVFVGGTLTLADGSEVDSRQRPIDQPTARAVERALTATADWWMAVSSIVLPALGDEQGRYALIWGARTVVRTSADGEGRRSSLRSVLHGGVGKVTVRRFEPSRSIASGHQEVVVLKNWQGVHMVAFGFGATRENVRWRIIDGIEFSVRMVADSIGASLIVDADGTLSSALFGGSDNGSFSVERGPAAPGARTIDVIVLPDTPRIRERVERALKPPERPDNTQEMPVEFDPTAPRNPDDYLRLAVLGARCSVTGLCRRGEWDDGSGLEAARLLLLRRFDLRLGLWDLAFNPVLRATVLETCPPEETPERAVQVPAGDRQRAVRNAARATERKQRSRLAVDLIFQSMRAVLSQAGWVIDERGGLIRPLTEPLSNWPDAPTGPLAALRFDLNKTSAQVVAWQWFYNDMDLRDFVTRRRAAFEAIAPLSDATIDAGRRPVPC